MGVGMYTIGYEGLDLGTFIWLLQKGGTEVLVDVRWTARSRNRAFSRTALDQALSEAGIDYVHMPELGVAPRARAVLKKTGDFDRYRRSYLSYLQGQLGALQRLHAVATEKCCCLMCMEHDPWRCHRSVLADQVSQLDGGGIVVTHL